MTRINSLAYVLGGGRGERLGPLTESRAKPAVPFAANYRVIDFVISNLYHSGIRKVLVLTQYNSESLHRHIKLGWDRKFGLGGDQFIETMPARQNQFADWYMGTADAIYQNAHFIDKERPNIVNVFGGDHIYLMDVSQMNDFHVGNNADLTISAIPVKRDTAAKALGVLEVDSKGRLVGFEEKPTDPKPIPGNEDYCLASMGNYTFKPSLMKEVLGRDAQKESSSRERVRENPIKYSTHDFGFDIIPSMLEQGKVIFVYNFSDNNVPGISQNERGFWKDIGTTLEFYNTNMMMRATVPPLNLYNSEWTVQTFVESHQPVKTVGIGALDSIVSNGTIISNSKVERAVISYGVRINDGSDISDSILMGYNEIGEGVVLKKVIVDRGVKIPNGTQIGVDSKLDDLRGFTNNGHGISIVPKGYIFSRPNL